MTRTREANGASAIATGVKPATAAARALMRRAKGARHGAVARAASHSRGGQREPYRTSGSGGSSYGSSGYGPYRGEGLPGRGSEPGRYGFGNPQGRNEWGRSRWGGPTDYGSERSGRYSESQYGTGSREYRGTRYGSGDFGYEWGRRGEPSFGEGNESPRYFGTGNYAEGGTHYTGGYEPRGTRHGYSGGDYGYESPRLGRDYGGSRGEPRYGYGTQQRLFKRGPKGYQRSDERLREDISERLMQASNVDSSEVTVSVSNGKVTLEGTVPDRYMKYYIEDLADAYPGVQDIENRIRVDVSSGRSAGIAGSGNTTGSATGTITGTGTTTSGGTGTASVGSSTSGGGRRRE